jgi:glutamate dehydrogenase
MREGRLTFEAKRNKPARQMTDEVAELVLEDNRLQTLALSIAEARRRRGPAGLRPDDRDARGEGRLDRKVEGLEAARSCCAAAQEGAA